jgi:PIN domain nuclease of toxin-antitoxin system
VILLLDTNALVWWLEDNPTLAPGARSAIGDASNEVIVSAATVWELAIKRAAGKIRVASDLRNAIESAGFLVLAVTVADAESAAGLPLRHRDPFDRMLVAQAIRLDASIVSRDRALDAYGVHRFEA